MMFRILLLAIFVLGVSPASYGQSANPRVGLTMQGSAEPGGNVIRDSLGKPCLDIEAAARSETVNPDMLEHVVSVKNNCSRLIKVKVCYYGSEQCKQFDLQGYKRVDTILGVMRAIRFFRYTLFQK